MESMLGDEDEQCTSPRTPRGESSSPRSSSSSSPSRADLLLSPPGRLPALPEGEVDDGQGDSVYLVLISLHGLVRGSEMELGRDSDTGGQVRYVVELARALAHHPRIHRCDLFTRLITDPSVDASYGVVEERLTEEPDGDAGAFIVRLRAGKPDVYLHKELLWPHLREFADRAIERIDGQLRSLESAHGRPFRLLCIHGHYADAAELSSLIGATLSSRVMVTAQLLHRGRLHFPQPCPAAVPSAARGSERATVPTMTRGHGARRSEVSLYPPGGDGRRDAHCLPPTSPIRLAFAPHEPPAPWRMRNANHLSDNRKIASTTRAAASLDPPACVKARQCMLSSPAV